MLIPSVSLHMTLQPTSTTNSYNTKNGSAAIL